MAEIARYARFQVVVFGGGKEKPRSRKRRRRRIVHSVRSLPRAMQPEARPRTTRHQLAFNPPASRRQRDPKQPAANPPPSPTRPPSNPPPTPRPSPRRKHVAWARLERRATVGVSCVRQVIGRRHRPGSGSRRRSNHLAQALGCDVVSTLHGITRLGTRGSARRRRRPSPHRHLRRARCCTTAHQAGQRCGRRSSQRGWAAMPSCWRASRTMRSAAPPADRGAPPWRAGTRVDRTTNAAWPRRSAFAGPGHDASLVLNLRRMRCRTRRKGATFETKRDAVRPAAHRPASPTWDDGAGSARSSRRCCRSPEATSGLATPATWCARRSPTSASKYCRAW